ncbi:hypothetical protein HF325_001810 [Metschnikowia pulcherrima]|uniref:Uncharacterized protein n=1 Tax=Metschnikowia pulcherrima TaxID=27326 RepID=A0A8H7LGT5_9ASCO|nr:hypothetical protein HF325_001810 [Metschnikowia pulcherrima]
MEASAMVSEKHSHRDQSEHINGLRHIQALLLSATFENTKYSFMSMFISRVLNLKDENQIFNPTLDALIKRNPNAEILPQITIPQDLWQASEIQKTEALEAANAILAQSLEELNEREYFTIDESLISSLKDRVTEQKFTELALESLHFTSLPEDEELEDQGLDSIASLKHLPTEADASSINSGSSRPSSFSGTRSSRVSSISRDLMLGKRKLSIFGHHQQKSEPVPHGEDRKSVGLQHLTPNLTSLTSLDTNTSQPASTQKASQINGLLLKSKFYNKLVKRRDLQALIPGLGSGSGALSSYRNSTSGTDPQDNTTLARSSYHMSDAQRAQNQRQKLEYYVQTRKLGDHVRQLAASFGRRDSHDDLVTLLEFVKNFIFRFVVVDICHMLFAKTEISRVRELLL